MTESNRRHWHGPLRGIDGKPVRRADHQRWRARAWRRLLSGIGLFWLAVIALIWSYWP